MTIDDARRDLHAYLEDAEKMALLSSSGHPRKADFARARELAVQKAADAALAYLEAHSP